MRLASFKLRFADAHVRIVPSTDAEGCVFRGPGVDVRGVEAVRVLAQAAPMLALFRALDSAVIVRAVSVDWRAPRVLATFEPSGSDARPAVLRIDSGVLLERLLDEARALESDLVLLAEAALARR